MVNGLAAGNLELEARTARMELENAEFERRNEVEVVELEKLLEKP